MTDETRRWSLDLASGGARLHRYLTAAEVAGGRRVLDLGCGDGAGAALLAGSAALVVGGDTDPLALQRARQRHVAPNLGFVQTAADRIAVASGSFDLVLGIGRVDSTWLNQTTLAEVKRVLRSGGVAMLATDQDEVEPLLQGQFRHVQVHRQRLIATSLIEETDQGGDAPTNALLLSLPGERSAPATPRSRIVWCSDEPLPPLPSSLLIDPRETMLRRYLDWQRQIEETGASVAAQIAAWDAQREYLEASSTWRAVERLQHLRKRLMPPGAIHDRLWMRAVKRVRRRGQSATDPYARWIAANEPTQAHHRRQRSLSHQARPSIAVIVPVLEPNERELQASIDSVLAQTTPAWELIVAHLAGQTMPEHGGDRRIRFLPLDAVTSLAEAANRAVGQSTADFVVILSAGDRLAPDALFEIVMALHGRPNVDLLYTDEDHLGEDGTSREAPWFKPGWSPELLLSANLVSTPVVRRARFEALGGFDAATAGAYLWDFALRAAEQLDRVAVWHLPRVLVHRRESDVPGRATTPPSTEVRRAIAAHLRRRGIADPDVSIDTRFGDYLRVSWTPPATKVSIVIPTRDRVEVLRPCLGSLLLLTTSPEFEVLLLDNGSHERQTVAFYDDLRTDPRVRIVDAPGPFNYPAVNNLGARHATGDYLLFLNNDIEVLEPDWLDEMVRWAARPEIGTVGTKLIYPYHRIQHAGIVLGLEGHAGHIFAGAREGTDGPFGSVEWYRNYLALTSACVMIRRQTFEAAGGLDERYQLAFSDIELGVRLVEAGYRNLYTPFARLRHHEGNTRGKTVSLPDMERGYEDLAGIVAAGDPFFNPNLSLASLLPRLAEPGQETAIDRLRRVIAYHGGALPPRPVRSRRPPGSQLSR